MICASNLKCREKFQSQDYKVIVEFDLLQREISIFNKKKGTHVPRKEKATDRSGQF